MVDGVVTSTDVPKKGRPAKSVFEADTEQNVKAKEHKVSHVNPAKQLLDAAKDMEAATKELTGGKILVKMNTDNFSYQTEGGTRFTKDHPYQLVAEGEADLLINNGGFRKASSQELLDYYK